MKTKIDDLLHVISSKDGVLTKDKLTTFLVEEFGLIKDRSVYFCEDYAIRISSSKSKSFSNTVLALSNLMKYDDKPFIVCLVTPTKNYCYLANTTLLKKISHSSQELRENNIKGSFNGSDIMRDLDGIENVPENFSTLFNIHENIGFKDNIVRLVAATNDISPTGKKFIPKDGDIDIIIEAPQRAINFGASSYFKDLNGFLDAKVSKYKDAILIASLIDNVNIRGRVIEYLIAGEDRRLRDELINSLIESKGGIPELETKNALGDYSQDFGEYYTETDVKTKIMVLDSNPKAYNLDKVLEFLATPRSVFMFYFVGVTPGQEVDTVLVSMFQKDLLDSTVLLKHWAGRNSRGVSQFIGKTVGDIILHQKSDIDAIKAQKFLRNIINL